VGPDAKYHKRRIEMKRAILFPLIALFALSLVAGVWAGGQGEKGGGAPVQLTWYFIGNGPQKDVDKVEAAVDKYIQGKGLNATVKLVWARTTTRCRPSSPAGRLSTSASPPCGRTTTATTPAAGRSFP
jgi:hypothetical protein